MKTVVIMPIYKPGQRFFELLNSLKKQTYQTFELLIIETIAENTPPYENALDGFHYEISKISAKDFDHGGTRQWGIERHKEKEIAIFLTQDAILADRDSLKKLIKVFHDKTIGCAYGRQLPHENADCLEAHARLYNYPAESKIISIKDKEKYGIKTVFMSDSFAAYRISTLKEIGGFPRQTIISEDMYVAAKMLLRGWKIAYCAEAKVYHSHNYSIKEEFKRYLAIGAFHAKENWIRKEFGKAEGEGRRFILSEMKYVAKRCPRALLDMLLRDGIKFLGYKFGTLKPGLYYTVKNK